MAPLSGGVFFFVSAARRSNTPLFCGSFSGLFVVVTEKTFQNFNATLLGLFRVH